MANFSAVKSKETATGGSARDGDAGGQKPKDVNMTTKLL